MVEWELIYLITDPYMGNVLLGNNWVQAYILSAVDNT